MNTDRNIVLYCAMAHHHRPENMTIEDCREMYQCDKDNIDCSQCPMLKVK